MLAHAPDRPLIGRLKVDPPGPPHVASMDPPRLNGRQPPGSLACICFVTSTPCCIIVTHRPRGPPHDLDLRATLEEAVSRLPCWEVRVSSRRIWRRGYLEVTALPSGQLDSQALLLLVATTAMLSRCKQTTVTVFGTVACFSFTCLLRSSYFQYSLRVPIQSCLLQA